MAVRARIEDAGEGELAVELSGELDFDSAPLFTSEILPTVERFRADAIIVDVTDVGFVDLRGLDLLLQVSLAAQPGGKITLLNPGPALYKLLDYMKAREVFDLVTIDPEDEPVSA